MNCYMTRGVYLRANGEMNCYCSTGEQITMAQLPTRDLDFNFMDVYRGGKFDHVRRSMVAEKLPFPSYCLKCNYLAPYDQPRQDLFEREIEWAHIEASAICNLRCPFCVHGIPDDERKYSRSGEKFIPPELYYKMLQDVADAGYGFKWMYFSGRGEPGLHPRLWEMVAKSKQMFETNFLVNTNGNIKYHDLIVDSGLDKIKIALESTNQELYGRYRINGHVDNIMALTEAIAERKAKLGVKTPRIIWQKVLFDYNDSDEELTLYQQKALDCGVDTIRLVFTYTENYSPRRPDQVPIFFPDIDINDITGRGNITVEELRAALGGMAGNSDTAPRMHLIWRLMHWFELGTKNRDQYDNYANLDVFDPFVFRLREGDPDLPEYLEALGACLDDLGDIYQGRGEAAEADRYRDWAGRVPRSGPSLAAAGAAR